MYCFESCAFSGKKDRVESSLSLSIRVNEMEEFYQILKDCNTKNSFLLTVLLHPEKISRCIRIALPFF